MVPNRIWFRVKSRHLLFALSPYNKAELDVPSTSGFPYLLIRRLSSTTTVLKQVQRFKDFICICAIDTYVSKMSIK